MPKGRRGSARVVVLTVIEDEFDAVTRALGAAHEVGHTSVFAPVAPTEAKPTLPFVVSRCAHRSNLPAQSSASKAIEDWRPEVLVLVGIGGGIMRSREAEGSVTWDGPEPGDIVIAEYVHYAEFTKNIPSGSKLRYFPIDQPTSSLVQAHGDALRIQGGIEKNAWHDGLGDRPTPGTPKVHIGEIIAVEGVAGDPMSAHQKSFLRSFDHAIAVDMESGGVARALHESRAAVHYNPRWMCVRAISDRVFATGSQQDEDALPADDNNEERGRWKAYAAASAGALTRRLLERLLSDPREATPRDPKAEAFAGWGTS